MKSVMAMPQVAQNDQKMHMMRQPARIAPLCAMKRCAMAVSLKVGDGGGTKPMSTHWARIIAPTSTTPDQTAAFTRPESISIDLFICVLARVVSGVSGTKLLQK